MIAVYVAPVLVYSHSLYCRLRICNTLGFNFELDKAGSRRSTERLRRVKATLKKNETQCPTGDVLGRGATHSNNYREEFPNVDGDIGTERSGSARLRMIITSVAVGTAGALRAGVLLQLWEGVCAGRDGSLWDKKARSKQD